MNAFIAAIFIGTMTCTAYRAVPEQTDSSPNWTSIGEHVHPHGIALSRDMLKRWGGTVQYGDTVYIEHIGFKVVNDVMASRHKRSVDVFVTTYSEEQQFDRLYRNQKLKMWKLTRRVYEQAQ